MWIQIFGDDWFHILVNELFTYIKTIFCDSYFSFDAVINVMNCFLFSSNHFHNCSPGYSTRFHMSLFFSCLLVVLAALCSGALPHDENCPYTWTRHITNYTDNCTCGNDLGGKVHCDAEHREVSILISYCMTYDNTTKETEVGSCPFSPVNKSRYGLFLLPKYTSELNEAMCGGPLHRAGRLCAKCQSGYGPGVLSYGHSCVECKKTLAVSWTIFILYTFVPVTFFFFIVLAFRLEVVSGPFTAYVFFAQVYSSPASIQFLKLLERSSFGISRGSFITSQTLLVSFYGIWNLDFGRLYLEDTCLSDKLTMMEVIGMELIIPFYMILLIILTFLIVELHGRSFKPLVVVWKPFSRCFSKFRADWKINDSLIHTIATVLLLSYTKLIDVSLRILSGVYVYNVMGKTVDFVPYFSADTKYFSGVHAALTLVAILTLNTLVAIPPIVLLLYPLRLSNRCTEKFCHPRLQYGLKTFVDSIQGCYKDRTCGRYDCRYAAGWYLLLRIIVAVGSLDDTFSTHLGRQIVAITLLLTAVGFAFFQPYKKYMRNIMDALHFIVLSLIYWFLLNGLNLMLLNRTNHVLSIIAFLSTLPIAYILLLAAYWVCFIKNFPQKSFYFARAKYCKRWRESLINTTEDSATERTPLGIESNVSDFNNSFADRLQNPASYAALVRTRQEILNRLQPKALTHSIQTERQTSHTQTETTLASQLLSSSGFTVISSVQKNEEEKKNVQVQEEQPTTSFAELDDCARNVRRNCGKEFEGKERQEGEVRGEERRQMKARVYIGDACIQVTSNL